MSAGRSDCDLDVLLNTAMYGDDIVVAVCWNSVFGMGPSSTGLSLELKLHSLTLIGQAGSVDTAILLFCIVTKAQMGGQHTSAQEIFIICHCLRAVYDLDI